MEQILPELIPIGTVLITPSDSDDATVSPDLLAKCGDESSSVHTCQDVGDYELQSGTFNAGGVFQLKIYSDGSCTDLIESFGRDFKGNFEPSNGGFMDGFTVVLGDGA